MALPRITVVISGRGWSLGSLLAAETAGRLHGTVGTVISNRADAAGLAVALAHGARINVVDHRAHAERERFDAALAAAVDASRPDLVVLAGFMRILGPDFVGRYRDRMLNIHPSLLPRWRGAAPIERAMQAGDRETGVSIMRLVPELDAGSVYAQRAVPLAADDDYASASARLLTVAVELLVDVLERRPEATPQDADGVTYAEKITAVDRSRLMIICTGTQSEMYSVLPHIAGGWTTHQARAGARDSLQDRIDRWHRALVDTTMTVRVLDDGIGVRGHVTVGAATRVGTTDGEILSLYIDPDHWGHGYGRALLHTGRQLLTDQGYERLGLWMVEGNTRALALYQSDGWALEGPREPFILNGVDYGTHELKLHRPN